MASNEGAIAIAEDIRQLNENPEDKKLPERQPTAIAPPAATTPATASSVEMAALRTRLEQLQGQLADIAAAAQADRGLPGLQSPAGHCSHR